jgi:hypothetical protein
VTDQGPIAGGLRTVANAAGSVANQAGGAAPAAGTAPRELFVRHARKDGRSVAVLRAVDYGDSCVVEAEVYPAGARNASPTQPGPYTFADAQQATAFVTEAVEALMVLGCDVHAQ